ncbi:hypothetical protein Bhyg_04562 [Pseudolycoriella hygida]|uniref:Uncharacterized protein n=1 Tax=Pseudolycoriella hygida TaxID=35572 RepID=A0A9Q0S9P6_9DIPT|nr:hypothetical protein Bhyg_04562 [Pseudolycoriella hygida]
MYNYSFAYQVLGSRFRWLGMPIEEVNERRQKNAKSKQRNSFALDLIKLVKDHRNLSETVKRFRDFFSLLFFAQVATSAISICISVYSLANIELFSFELDTVRYPELCDSEKLISLVDTVRYPKQSEKLRTVQKNSHWLFGSENSQTESLVR